ncbi:uncharacterized protein LOC105192456 [Harpegnathos saltator]|uniref:Uncharacterized protein n=1 Tax=Harpegnathos saltator TaxID=610380 RepID=E2B957_HARSA|nr:uncharacterized protein LOC105192456 [Harpegnathos saltator]XP_011154919.1 uncharacterized protein LOC105192456 [Harpegnathos saltator]XP_011154920.1 uncharacterized protein LOC105192456 [Harpegnathos saltator]XP_011154922.1 uncharacterized protein LOC105192456 [Harpegnathos saltator]XP_019701236.1 uncharacterized protein LOC105192456 [Harpegnathos saltator]XP_019701237.1 uncharacterized protein LOC105192456 [Harpegnathos saltator]XP_025159831.1 uncharacterized protein LOC105192456 [Harpeg
MHLLPINSFAAKWLLLCLMSPPLYSGAEIPLHGSYEVNDPMRYQFRSMQSDKVPAEERQSDIGISQLDQRDKEIRKKDEEIMKKMNILSKILSEDSDESDVESRNIIENNIIAESNISEETKRVVRQVSRQRPGFFWTLARLAFETYNDTRSAIQQINNIVGENFEPDTTTQLPSRSNSLTMINAKSTTPLEDQNNMSSNLANVNVTTTATTAAGTTTTTTARPFKFTVNGVQNIIRRNLRGLVRLFNLEWQDALNQSEINVREFQKDLGNQVGSFLQDNPNAF